MSQNVETLQAGYEAFARGDLEAAMENFQDDIRWENPNAPPGPQRRHPRGQGGRGKGPRLDR